MEGSTVSHYTILDKLGGGGMGVVYRARDDRLKRIVAIKFLPPELTRDEEAKQRFLHEAEAASALDHINICTVHEIDRTPEGQIFLVMAYYEGNTLKQRIGQGPLSVDAALDFAIQIANGLARAHEHGIVHRDIKPANLIATDDGVIKIVDFGIAKLEGQTSITRTGSRVGTAAYMSPEQISGSEVDQRADIWSLGVVLRELLTGQPAFPAEHEASLINAIVNEEPASLHEMRPEVPRRLERIVARAMAKRPESRYASARELADDLTEFRQSLQLRQTGQGAVAPMRALRNPRIALAAVLGTAAVVGLISWTAYRGAEARSVRDQTLPEIRRLAENDAYIEAFELAETARRVIGDDSELLALIDAISTDSTFDSVPGGAQVRIKPYSDVDQDWQLLGTTPLSGVRLPRGVHRVQIGLEGYDTVEKLSLVGVDSFGVTVELVQSDSADSGMVAVEGGTLELGFIVLASAALTAEAPGYLLDRSEVSNADFKAFLDSGGYRNSEFWPDEFLREGNVIGFDEARNYFVDITNQQGPHTWTAGNYPAGDEDLPVTGVSWYEAAAYCAFVGKTLPTIYHWGNAATMARSADIIPLSNFGQAGPEPVGASMAVSQSGAVDMAGNVREWVLNSSGDERYIVGGAWTDPNYKFYEPETRAPFDRTDTNGFRCARYDAASPAVLAQDIPLPNRDYSDVQPVAEEVFRAYRNQHLYDAGPLNESVESREEMSRWTRETVTYDTAYGERMTAYLFLPGDGTSGPYQVGLLWPGARGFSIASSSEDIRLENTVLTGLPLSGRALLWPVFDGTYERNRGDLQTGYFREDLVYRDYAIRWVKDAMRSIDYLEARDDIDTDSLALITVSWGSQHAPVLATVDSRIKVAILMLAGLPQQLAQPEIDTINFVSRLRIPTLILGGEFDAVFPLESSQKPLFELLGTPLEDKRHHVFEGVGHGLPLNETIGEILGWLDKYQPRK